MFKKLNRDMEDIKKTQNQTSSLNNKNKVERLILITKADHVTYHKTKVIKTVILVQRE